jgi:hypothetical protein
MAEAVWPLLGRVGLGRLHGWRNGDQMCFEAFPTSMYQPLHPCNHLKRTPSPTSKLNRLRAQAASCASAIKLHTLFAELVCLQTTSNVLSVIKSNSRITAARNRAAPASLADGCT